MNPSIALVQFQPQHGELRENLDVIASHIESVDAHVIVFPELATCGYLYTNVQQLKPQALEASSQELTRLNTIASTQNKVIVFGFAELSSATGQLYNSAMICGANVQPYVYRKTHLFYKEHMVFTKGDTGFHVVKVPHLDLNIGMMICYDWRFPESARSLALKGADIIAVPSNLVTQLWPKVMPARAIENSVYVAVANRIGTEQLEDDHLTFTGQSALYSPSGECAVVAPLDATSVQIATINPELARNKSFNEFNDIFTDRRPEMY